MPASERIGNLIHEVETGIIVHQVNAQGVMKSGFAKELRERYPAVYDDYIRALGPPYTQYNGGSQFMGQCIWTKLSDNLIVCSLVGQQFYGREEGKRYTSYDALDLGFATIARRAFDAPIHYPLIGCGLGGADWTIVSAIIETHLGKMDHTLWKQP